MTNKKRFVIEETHTFYKTVKHETFAETEEKAVDNYNNDKDLTEIWDGSLNGGGVDFETMYEEDLTN